MKKKKTNKKIGVIFWFTIFLIYLLANILFAVCDWFNSRFGVSFEEILFTITSPLSGSDTGFLDEAVEYVFYTLPQILPILIPILVIAIFFYLFKITIEIKFWKIPICLDFYNCYQILCLLLALSLFGDALSYGVESLQLDSYIERRLQKTTIYEDYYVEPSTEIITLEGEKKNLLYIYIESMETTYASIEDGGAQEVNYIPNLTQLANENISFSDTEKLGGAHVNVGASWTMGALFSITSGVPFSFPVDANSMNAYAEFAPGITALGDILHEYGYTQVFLCGSNGNFAGRAKYFQQHGPYEMHDYYYAVEKGYIPQDYYVWWGYEDQKLYDIAKTELLELAESGEPFNYTMLTVDTHHVDGFVCENCKVTYGHTLANVLECADNQIYDFILWCQQQDFYEDTVIIITGDHYRMDSSLVADKERRLYNCIINSDTEVLGSKTNRIFTSLDLFPTTLSAMGFNIEGNRLGLGTDMFSGKSTLAEELGLEALNAELGKYSDYYVEEFE